MIIFGSDDPHVPAEARLQILSALYAAGLEDTSSCTSTAAASTLSCATSVLGTIRS